MVLAACADGIHIASERAGPVVEHCRVGLNGDDAIAIHGGFNLVTQPNPSARTIVALRLVHWVSVFFKRGDQVKIYNRESRLHRITSGYQSNPCELLL